MYPVVNGHPTTPGSAAPPGFTAAQWANITAWAANSANAAAHGGIPYFNAAGQFVATGGEGNPGGLSKGGGGGGGSYAPGPAGQPRWIDQAEWTQIAANWATPLGKTAMPGGSSNRMVIQSSASNPIYVSPTSVAPGQAATNQTQVQLLQAQLATLQAQLNHAVMDLELHKQEIAQNEQGLNLASGGGTGDSMSLLDGMGIARLQTRGG